MAELSHKIEMMSMKVKDLWKGTVPPAASSLVHIPGGGLLDGDESTGYLQGRKEKRRKKPQVYLICRSFCCPL